MAKGKYLNKATQKVAEFRAEVDTEPTKAEKKNRTL